MWILLVLGCRRTEPPPPPDPPATSVDEEDALTGDELEAREQLIAIGIAVSGELAGDDGAPIAGASVRIGDSEVTTDEEGAFRFDGVPRDNALLEVSAEGFRPHVRPLWLLRPVAEDEVVLDPLRLRAQRPDEARFLFGGDVSFGRRFLDPDESTPRDEVPPSDPTALIDAADPLPGSLDTVQWMEELFATADERVVNVETVVTDDPSTPHLEKDYVIFTLPGSLPALDALGVRYVSLGNNHVYDYLDAGVADTIAHVEAAGFAHSGAGLHEDEAWVPHRFDLAGVPYSYVSATSVSGRQWSVSYVATDAKGGAADLRDDERFTAAVSGEVDAGRVPIALLHTGTEYTTTASDFARERMQLAVDAGAALVIGHHTHVAQGVERMGDTLSVHCLGNFVFDQARLETMLAVVAQVELSGPDLVGAELVPIYLEDHRPRLLVGPVADALLRRLSDVSIGVPVVPWGNRALVAWDAQPAVEERTVTVDVEVGPEGTGVLDARELLAEGESVAALQADVPGATVQAGWDLLSFGTFEDDDVDDDDYEVSRWDVTSAASWPCLTGARTGAVGLCQLRGGDNIDPAVVSFRNRIRVEGDADNEPVKDLLLVGYTRGEGAGDAAIVARYYASEGDAEFGEERFPLHETGVWEWTPFAFPLALPPDGDDPLDPTANARAVRIFLHHEPPPDGEPDGILAWDDLAVVSLAPPVPLDGAGATFTTPHARDVFQVEAPTGVHAVEVTLRRQIPLYSGR